MKLRKLIIILSTLILLSGCGQSSTAPAVSGENGTAAAPPASSSPDASAGAQQPSAASTPEDGGADAGEVENRSSQKILSITLEGISEEIPATLYQGTSWSIYIPDEGWTAADVDAEDRETAWDSRVNPSVEFGVEAFPGADAETAFQRFAADEEDYVFGPLTEGSATGHDDRDGETMYVRAVAAEGETYLFWAEYPDEATEGFGALLEQIGAELQST